MKINEPEAYMKFKCSPVQKKKKKKKAESASGQGLVCVPVMICLGCRP